jgi:hypothetical protein
MRQRRIEKFRPALEALEAKQLPSTATLPGALVDATDRARESALHVAAQRAPIVPKKFLVYRITNPKNEQVDLTPPFDQVLVQSPQPVPGQTYNVLYVAVKNETYQTFTAQSGFTVTTSGNRKLFPFLTGNQQWTPGKWIVFYVLTKKYYPLRHVAGGFLTFTGGRRSTLVPGPSGIFLRLKYDPATFARTLNWIVAFGQGAQLGAGAKLGLPDTAINQLVAGRTQRMDFAGHF